jgi:hypothetical protein
MAITVQANPVNLTWANFQVTPNKILDPNDNTLQDSYTTFRYNIPDLPPRTVNGQLMLADPMTITLTPYARVWSGVQQTAALLSHEEWHYHVGIVVARAFAREAARLHAPDMAGLRTAFQTAFNLHFITRVHLLQSRYDRDTLHGTQAHYQKIWKDRMTACLANPRADQLGGFWL